jgi:acyl-CoA thioester hydrolase
MKPRTAAFSFWHPVDVRFKDIDVGGHAHHSVALVYFEEARSAFWQEAVGMGSLDEVDFILAEAKVRYQRRVLYPQRLRVGLRASRIGKKHFVLEYLALDQDGQECLWGETTLIMYDYAKGQTKKISPQVRSALEEVAGDGDHVGEPGESDP